MTLACVCVCGCVGKKKNMVSVIKHDLQGFKSGPKGVRWMGGERDNIFQQNH